MAAVLLCITFYGLVATCRISLLNSGEPSMRCVHSGGVPPLLTFDSYAWKRRSCDLLGLIVGMEVFA